MTYKIAPFLATHSKQSAHARRLGHNELLEREIFIPSAPLPPSPTTQGQISLSLSAFAYAHAGRNENKRERERICIAERPYARRLSLCLSALQKRKLVGCEVQNSYPPYLFTAPVCPISCHFNETPAPEIFAAVSQPVALSIETDGYYYYWRDARGPAFRRSIDRAATSLCCFGKCSRCNDLAVAAAPKFPPSFGTGA